VYEPEAVAYEETAGKVKSEYRRRIRIVSRSWRAVFQAPGVLNPFRVGLFSWCLFSHKILRWWSGFIAIVGGIAALTLGARLAREWPLPALAVGAGTAGLVAFTPVGRRAAAMCGYFAVLNIASLIGVLKGSIGNVSGVWSTPREHTRHASALAGLAVPIGPLFLVIGAAFVLAAGMSFVGWHEASMGVFWVSVGVLVYVYAAYPVLLFLLRLVGRHPIRRGDVEPAVCLLIAANDEESVIEAKLRNALALDYPADKLDIVVASDGSVDRTNAIVRAFAPRVRLHDFEERSGKIAAINRSIQSVTADIVVFSDANTFLDPSAIRNLVQPFADPDVGAVSGDVALIGERAALARSEDLYYLYEHWVQRAESEVGSMIGADGALYAIRRYLYTAPADDTILDDMSIPMSVVRAGYRVVFEPGARAHEQGSDTAREEFARKSRVVAGAVQFLSRRDSSVPLGAPQVMFSLISHKALRWLSPAFATSALITSVFLAGESLIYTGAALAQVLLVALGIAGCIPAVRRNSLVAFAHYFCLVQAAAAVGFIRGLSGRQSVRWRRFMRMPVKQSEA
jgi:cellulose synthase/poly-beta-1,6-N-acetylglucosamine synthase-like glycosyltransferase